MFCYQCEQTENGTGCTVVGVCGKTPEVAALQDELVHDLKHLSQWAHRARAAGVDVPAEVNTFTLDGMFSTLTNVNFDDASFRNKYLPKCRDLTQKLSEAVRAKAPHAAAGVEQAPLNGVLDRRAELGDNVAGLQELITYGLKGVAAYASHAQLLGKRSDNVYAEVHRILSLLGDQSAQAHDPQTLLGAALDVGKVNLEVLQLLDAGHTEKFGHPEPTSVSLGPSEGKCILVSGHDIHDLHQLLEQTQGKGINVYTHGELLPAHSYPELKKYPHLKGNYGGPWNLQKFEFAKFPGPIVMTTNCLIEPRKSYQDRLFTVNSVSWPGCTHIESDVDGNKDFSQVIEAAQASEGYTVKNMKRASALAGTEDITVGFGHHTILGVADKVLEAVGKGDISHFFLIGGCDGNELSRSYFRDLALSTSQNHVILTLGCGKYRFIKDMNQLGTVPNLGIPRVLDMGQCNDAYGAVMVATALADALGCGVNDLPLSFAVSWFEQKAVAVLLTLLHLGVKNIALGPNLPAFVAPETLTFLNTNLGLRPTNVEHVDEDMKLFTGGAVA